MAHFKGRSAALAAFDRVLAELELRIMNGEAVDMGHEILAALATHGPQMTPDELAVVLNSSDVAAAEIAAERKRAHPTGSGSGGILVEPKTECLEKRELFEALKAASERLASLRDRQREAILMGNLEQLASLDSSRRRELNVKGDLLYAYRAHVREHGC